MLTEEGERREREKERVKKRRREREREREREKMCVCVCVRVCVCVYNILTYRLHFLSPVSQNNLKGHFVTLRRMRASQVEWMRSGQER